MEPVQGGDVPLPPRRPGQERRVLELGLHRPGLHHVGESHDPPTGEGHPPHLSALIDVASLTRERTEELFRSLALTARRNPVLSQPLTRITDPEIDLTY